MARKNLIPKKFIIDGQEFDVKIKPDIDVDGAIGLTEFYDNKVSIRNKAEGKDIKKSQMEQTFYHELGHVFMISMDEHKLNLNEKFINQLGSRLYQFMKYVQW